MSFLTIQHLANYWLSKLVLHPSIHLTYFKDTKKWDGSVPAHTWTLLEHLHDVYKVDSPTSNTICSNIHTATSIFLQAIQNLTPTEERAIVMEIEAFFSNTYVYHLDIVRSSFAIMSKVWSEIINALQCLGASCHCLWSICNRMSINHQHINVNIWQSQYQPSKDSYSEPHNFLHLSSEQNTKVWLWPPKVSLICCEIYWV